MSKPPHLDFVVGSSERKTVYGYVYEYVYGKAGNENPRPMLVERASSNFFNGLLRSARMIDWQAWARRVERALDVAGRGDWQALFAPGATFGDPHTPSTTDLRSVARHTRRIFPDWTQQITRIRGAENWAVFEWIGRGTFTMPDSPGNGTPVKMHGATIVEIDENGLITSWRDYLDRKEPEEQILAAIQAGK